MIPTGLRTVGIPLSVAVALPLGFAQFSPLGAVLSLLVSVLLVMTAVVTTADLLANKRRAPSPHRFVHLDINTPTPTTRTPITQTREAA